MSTENLLETKKPTPTKVAPVKVAAVAAPAAKPTKAKAETAADLLETKPAAKTASAKLAAKAKPAAAPAPAAKPAAKAKPAAAKAKPAPKDDLLESNLPGSRWALPKEERAELRKTVLTAVKRKKNPVTTADLAAELSRHSTHVRWVCNDLAKEGLVKLERNEQNRYTVAAA